MRKKNSLRRLLLSAMLLALALILPFFTGQIPRIGKMLCPMHLPVLLCGFFCGPWYGLAVGLLAPLSRSLLFGSPPLLTIGLPMCAELAAYGAAAGLLYRRLRTKRGGIYLSLLGAMAAGRLLWGLAKKGMFLILGLDFGWSLFFAGAVLDALPGIAVQIVLIPLLVATPRRGQAAPTGDEHE